MVTNRETQQQMASWPAMKAFNRASIAVFVALLAFNTIRAEQWAVHVEGGEAAASSLASSLNLENHGEIVPGSHIFHLTVPTNGHQQRTKRSAHSLDKIHRTLQASKEASWVEKQRPLKRSKRMNEAASPLDPQLANILPSLRQSGRSSETDCMVNTVSTPEKGSRRCVFPFTFRGKTYHKCTTDHSTNGRKWCATQLHANGRVLQGQWGDCDTNCFVQEPSSFNGLPGSIQGPPPPSVHGHIPPLSPHPGSSARPAPPVSHHQLPLEELPSPLFSGGGSSTAFLTPSFQQFQGLPQLTTNVDRAFLKLLTALGGGDQKVSQSAAGEVDDVVDIRGQQKLEDLEFQWNDPLWPQMWYLNRGNDSDTGAGLDMNVQEAWKRGATGNKVVVTILDDGVEWSHPDLEGNFDHLASTDLNGKPEDHDPFPRYDLFNSNKHGTRCAGQVAALANNSLCGVGIAFRAKIGGIRVLDGPIVDALEARALSFNRDYVDVYSASWGPDDDGRTVDGPGLLARMALKEGVSQGRKGLGSIYVWASGNGGKSFDNCNADGYTTSIYTLSVSSVSEFGTVPWYSEPCSSSLATTFSSGSTTKGERKIITTDLRGSCTSKHTGTSASSPIAAAIIALGLETNPSLTWRDVQHIVVRTSRPRGNLLADWAVNAAGLQYSHAYGFGLMDAAALVDLAANWTTVPQHVNCTVVVPTLEKSIWPNGSEDYPFDVSVGEECGGEVNFMEHLHLRVDLSSQSRRGDISLTLKSPKGTVSELMGKRLMDNVRTGFGAFNKWPMMSVHFWGENPSGRWTLTVRNEGDGRAQLSRLMVVFYGTQSDPQPGTPLKPNLMSGGQK